MFALIQQKLTTGLKIDEAIKVAAQERDLTENEARSQYLKEIEIREVEWEVLPQFGCFVKAYNGTLYSAPMGEKGELLSDEYYEVTAPESQDFLDAANRMLGTDFNMNEF